jgi:amidase
VGLKPSRGRTTLAPEFGDLNCGLVAEHVVCRSVRDTAAILDAVHGAAPGDPYVAPPPERAYLEEVGADPGRLRIGIRSRAPGGQFETHPECVTAAEEAGKLLESLGHGVEESAPEALDDPEYIEKFIGRWATGVAFELDYWARKTGKEVTAGDVEASTWTLAELARSLTAPQYLSALEHQQNATRQAARWWVEGFDLLLTPTMGEPATKLGEFDPDPENPVAPIMRSVAPAGFTAYWNTTGQPAISLPLQWDDDGLPIGIQLVAELGREDLLIRVAAQLEEAKPWSDHVPLAAAA